MLIFNRTKFDDGELTQKIAKCRDIAEVISIPGLNLEIRGDSLVCIPCAGDKQNLTGPHCYNPSGFFDINQDAYIDIPKQTCQKDEQDLKEIRQKNKSFQNLKKSIVRHYKEGRCTQKPDLEKERKVDGREKTIGMNLGRIVYKIVCRGRSYLDYEGDVLCAKMNGVDVGELNHSRMFVPKLLGTLSTVTQNMFIRFFRTPMQKTGSLPPIAVAADLATFQGTTRHMVSVISVFPDCKNLIQAVPVGSEVVPSDGRKGDKAAQQIGQAVKDFGIEKAQIVSTAMDGAYFNEKVPAHLEKHLDIEEGKIFHCWDPMHKGGLTEKHVLQSKHSFVNEVVETVAEVFKHFKWGIRLKLLQETAEEISAVLLKPESFSETRMANHKAKVNKGLTTIKISRKLREKK